MDSETTIAGLDELKKALDDLPGLLQKKVMRGALRAGQKTILEQARANVPVKDGVLRDSLRISTRSRGTQVTATLKAGSNKAFYARWVEFGTAAHYIAPKSKAALAFLGLVTDVVHHPGAQKRPFMRPALDNRGTDAVNAFADYMRKRIEAENIKALAALPDETDTNP